MSLYKNQQQFCDAMKTLALVWHIKMSPDSSNPSTQNVTRAHKKCARVARVRWQFYIPHQFQRFHWITKLLLIFVERHIREFVVLIYFADRRMPNKKTACWQTNDFFWISAQWLKLCSWHIDLSYARKYRSNLLKLQHSRSLLSCCKWETDQFGQLFQMKGETVDQNS